MRTEKLFEEIGKVDDTLIEESRVTKIPYTKKNKKSMYIRRVSYSVGGVAAALLLFMAGSFLVSDLLSGNDDSAKQESTLDTSDSLLDDTKREEDYSQYFSKDFSQFLCIDYSLEAGGNRYELTGQENMPELPFDTSMYEEFSATIYADEDNQPCNVRITLAAEAEEQYLSLIVSRDGDTFAECGLDGQPYTAWYGVKIYGFDKGEGSLSACFVKDGMGYTLQADNISYEQMWKNVQALLDEGINLDDFDLTDATSYWTDTKTLSLSQADQLSFIKEIVPDKEQYDGYQLCESNYFAYYEGEEITSEEYDIIYENSNKKQISLSYQTKQDGQEYRAVKLSELTEEMLDSMYMDGTYSGCIELENVIVDISADCDKSTILSVLNDSVLKE